MEPYLTIENASDTVFTERRSRFIGRARPVRTEEEALAFLHDIRTELWDATHHVYAYCLREGGCRRFSDDGEPQGTAGKPVLDVLLKKNVTDAAVVVTRYFGGILLGAGGLVRAYSHSASLALEQAGIVTMKPCVTAELTCEYGLYGRVGTLIAQEGGVVDGADFTDSVKVRFHLEPSAVPAFEARLADTTRGACRMTAIDEKYYKF